MNQKDIQIRTYGEDLELIQKKDPNLQKLIDTNGESMVLVSPGYQGKVFTSTYGGLDALSIGWVNKDAILSEHSDPQMNAYGGENRLWIGPEGSRFSVFFAPGKDLEFPNWKTPEAIDTEAWNLDSSDQKNVWMSHEMHLVNNAGTEFDVRIERTVSLLSGSQIEKLLKVSFGKGVKSVAYSSDNILRNIGAETWSRETGGICIWMLDMFSPSEDAIIIMPYKQNDIDLKNALTTDYFGSIDKTRLCVKDGIAFLRADGKSRGKIGVSGSYALPWAASFDSGHKLFTFIEFDVDNEAIYLNQEWNKDKDPFKGDAVNAYNDGPLEDGSQMGPFYELESCSPAAFLEAGSEIHHKHSVYHFSGEMDDLSLIIAKLTGLRAEDINMSIFN